MKVTVCFGGTSVVVPCGDGSLLVSQLIDKAIVRYRKARGRPASYWVAVHTLKANDGGILDADDTLCDVADDREQLIAVFEEQGGPLLHHNGGDGTSASSVGTESPDIFQGREDGSEKGFRPYLRDVSGSKTDVIITQKDLDQGSSLIVRRGSEPVLTNVGNSSQKAEVYSLASSNRWSASEHINTLKTPQESEAENESLASNHRHSNNDLSHQHRLSNDQLSNQRPTPHSLPQSRPAGFAPQEGGNEAGEEVAREGEPDDVGAGGSLNSFARDSTRRSLANNAAMWKWLDAQEKQEDKFQMEHEDRKEPLGSSEDTQQITSPLALREARLITLPNSTGPLGIHVVPDYDASGRDMGLVIQGIEPGGRVFQDGRLKVLDRIVEINGQSLLDVDFHRAQEIFKQALHASELRLQVVDKDLPPLPDTSPPSQIILSNRLSSGEYTDATMSSANQTQSPAAASAAINERGIGAPSSPSTPPSTSPPLSPKKTPPPLPARHPTTALTGSNHSAKARIIAPTNTKKIGKKIDITLTKGAAGLGFSVTTRDNPAGGVPPIYIKKILPTGAAIQDGRLKPGDMLLEVAGVDMGGRTQQDAVQLLRDTPPGGAVSLLVSRIVVEEDPDPQQPAQPKQLPNKIFSQHSPKHLQPSQNSHKHLPASHDALQPPDKADDLLSANITPELLEFDIPLKVSKAAGLGVSVKGKTSSQQGQKDLGIFIKDIIEGGAAQKDGRLAINDQLVRVNGASLLGVSNTVAMDTLRRAMQQEGGAESIELVVARRHLPAQSHPRDVRISTSDVASLSPELSPVAKDIKDMDKNANKNNYMDLNAATASSGESSGQRLVLPGHHPRQRSADGGYHGNNTDAAPVTLRPISSSMKPRPASTLGFQAPEKRRSNEQELLNNGAPRPPDWLQLELENKEVGVVDGPSPTEPLGFSREGFGRQSMSEKRKGYQDPRLTDFYHKVKSNREKNMPYYSETWDPRKSKMVYEAGGTLKRAGSAESLLGHNEYLTHDTCVAHGYSYYQNHSFPPEYPFGLPPPYINPFTGKRSEKDLGPTLGLKKSSSLESLQTAVQEVVQEEDEAEEGFYRQHTNKGLVRGRGCNESFRAAVDRSYDNQTADTMETQPSLAVDEESDTGSNLGRTSRGSSFSDKDEEKKRKKGKKEKSGEKDSKPGLFSGLFKFGKNRKTVEERLPSKSSSELHKERLGQHRRDAAEVDKIREQQRIVQEKQKQHEMNKQREEQLRTQTSTPPPDSPRQPPPQQPDPALPRQPEPALPRQLETGSAGQAGQGDGGEMEEGEERQGGGASQQAPPPQYRAESASYPQPASQGGGVSKTSSPGSRTEHIQNIRARLQQQHRDRNGVYPLDDQQEQTERRLQQIETQIPSYSYLQHIRKQRLLEEQKKHGVIVSLPRDASPPPANRSQARVDPEMSHYANLHEIRAHLRYHDYMQQEYRARHVPRPQAPPPQPSHPAPSHPGHSHPIHPPLSKTSSHPTPSGLGHKPLPGSRDPRLYPPAGSHSSPNQHYSDPRSRPPPAPDSHAQAHNRLYSRSHDPRTWEQSYSHGRSLTPGPPPVRSVTTPIPVNPRAQTPANQMFANNQQRVGSNNGVPPQLTANGRPPELRGGPEHVYATDARSTDHRGSEFAYRQHSDYDSSTKNSYTRERQVEPSGSHSYGSLPRQRDLKEKRYYSHGNLQPSLMSSSAQV